MKKVFDFLIKQFSNHEIVILEDESLAEIINAFGNRVTRLFTYGSLSTWENSQFIPFLYII